MIRFSPIFLTTAVATTLKRQCEFGINTGGYGNRGYGDMCTAIHETVPVHTVLMFTRDTGHHSSGWWKNPDYERCYHLSLSFRDASNGSFVSRDRVMTRGWLDAFYGDNKRLLWCEPPCSPQGKKADVWHYRLFMAPDWRTPIIPRGEVYSRDWTPAHWKSFSDVQADLDQAANEAAERAGAA